MFWHNLRQYGYFFSGSFYTTSSHLSAQFSERAHESSPRGCVCLVSPHQFVVFPRGRRLSRSFACSPRAAVADATEAERGMDCSLSVIFMKGPFGICFTCLATQSKASFYCSRSFPRSLQVRAREAGQPGGGALSKAILFFRF